MANILRFKRRASGAAGAPSSLMETEPAYNAVDDTLYLGIGSAGAGGSATSIKAIAGSGAFVDKTGSQTVSGNKTFTGTIDLSSATIPSFSIDQNLTIVGNLVVQGTTTTISSSTIDVADKNIELGKVSSPTDTTANGGGLTLKGSTDHTFNWLNATDSWTSSEHLELVASKNFRIDGAVVLSKTGLGSTVLASSLTSVGTITSGVWSGTDIGVAHGGTGASNASQARTNLGVAIGTNVQAYDAQLDELATMAANTASALADLSQAEVQILDGATVTTAELNKLDGATVTTSEINILDGVTASTSEINKLDGLTATTTELNYIDGVTSNLQTQLDNKQPLDSELTELATMASATASALADLTSVEVGILDGATVTTTELNIIDGGTSATSTTLALADRMVINDNGTMKQVAFTDLITFLENGTASGFDLDGGTY